MQKVGIVAMKIKRLPDSELEVLMALWTAQGEAPRAFLDEKLKNKDLASNTINTYLSRLLEKGFIACERRGKTNYYTPLVKEEEYLEFESKAVLSKFYGSSLKNFVISVCRNDSIAPAEIDELQRLLDELKRKKTEGDGDRDGNHQ
jgi:predicted transcriptional regulator